MAFTQYIPDYENRPEWNPASAQQPPAQAPAPTGGFGMVAPAPAPTGIISGAMAPPPAPTSTPPPAPGGFGMVGGAPATPTAPAAPGGLQAIYDANKNNPAAVAAWMKEKGYTSSQQAADELKIPVGYVDGWFNSAGITASQYTAGSATPAPAGFGMVGGPVAPPPAGPTPFGMVGGPPPAPGTPTPFATYVNQNLTNPQAVATAIKDKQFTSWEQAAGEMGYPADAEGVKFIRAYLERNGFGPDQYNTWLKPGSPGMAPPPAGSPISGVGTPGAPGASISPPPSGGIVSSEFSRTALGPQTNWDVTAPQTVEGRIKALIDPNNPLIAQARAQALQMAGERGLMNSSMAMTAADAAAYQVAMPIAQSDAQTFAKAAGYNADQANQRNLAEVTMANQFTTQQMNNANEMGQAQLSADTSLANARLGADTNLGTARIGAQSNLDQANLQAQNQQTIAKLNNDSQQLINKMDSETRATLQNTLNSSNLLIQTNSQAAQLFNTHAQAIDSIQRSTTMNSQAKTQAVAYTNYQLQLALNVLGSTSGLNLSDKLDMRRQPGFNADGVWVGFPEESDESDESDEETIRDTLPGIDKLIDDVVTFATPPGSTPQTAPTVAPAPSRQ